jgi:hypothetical protein
MPCRRKPLVVISKPLEYDALVPCSSARRVRLHKQAVVVVPGEIDGQEWEAG